MNKVKGNPDKIHKLIIYTTRYKINRSGKRDKDCSKRCLIKVELLDAGLTFNNEKEVKEKVEQTIQ